MYSGILPQSLRTNQSSVTQRERDVDNTCSSQFESDTEDLINRLKKRAEIRRQILTRKSVQEGKPDRLADLLEEAADRLRAMLGR